LLLVASDRISAFDFVLPDPIPFKGEVLTKLSLFWFDLLSDVVPNHFLSADVADLPEQFAPHAKWLQGRFMLVKKAEVFPVECIVRGYLAGSGLKEYQSAGTVCGIELPAGLVESSRLDDPLFTPSTKAEIGDHDENISFERMVEIVGAPDANELRDKSIAVYSAAREHAASRGIIIADTKFEFGTIDGQITLVDEVLTPDSSRFWPADTYAPGAAQPSFDKQFVRDWLEGSGWDKLPPAPSLPPEVVDATSEKYIQAYESITGRRFEPEGDA
jgi:phosphoribosylaminoimidazole-succinocarboxamide synthase